MKKARCVITIEADGDNATTHMEIQGIHPMAVLGHLRVLEDSIVQSVRKSMETGHGAPKNKIVVKDIDYFG